MKNLFLNPTRLKPANQLTSKPANQPTSQPANHKAQSILEYAILLSVVSVAIVTMAMYVRRAVQSKLYQIEYQAEGRQNVTRGLGY